MAPGRAVDRCQPSQDIGSRVWSGFAIHDEFGQATGTTASTGAVTYGWLGSKQRQTITAPFILMGARLYNPLTGRFTSPDPIPGGNENAYVYPTDPINQDDLTGQCSRVKMSVGCSRHPDTSKYNDWQTGRAEVALLFALALPVVTDGAAVALERTIGEAAFDSEALGADSELFGNYSFKTLHRPAGGGRFNRVSRDPRLGWTQHNGQSYFSIRWSRISVNNGHFRIIRGRVIYSKGKRK
uniref:RHS repeat-associated core domain-containing protein n=1 Tax=Galbitalea sp. SE-J8 TaxID=3054952 RepID=UPI00259C7B17|nr:RHS repeat-associated core domain-containing protein [Galbitalea sp. SE-J8]MDM4764417.1 RHS repeat-associated core domain-containing protein [Galbitalea sp. SE-J8]